MFDGDETLFVGHQGKEEDNGHEKHSKFLTCGSAAGSGVGSCFACRFCGTLFLIFTKKFPDGNFGLKIKSAMSQLV